MGNRYQSNSQLYFFIDFYRLVSEINFNLRLLSIIGLSIDYAWYIIEHKIANSVGSSPFKDNTGKLTAKEVNLQYIVQAD